jgi:hypothetical protein
MSDVETFTGPALFSPHMRFVLVNNRVPRVGALFAQLQGWTPTIFFCSVVLGRICAFFKALTHARTNRHINDKLRHAMVKCPEPSVDEMMNDPIVRALMAADGVDPGELQQLLRLIAEHLRCGKSTHGDRTMQKRYRT